MANASEPFSAPTTEKDIEILNLLELEDQARKVISKGPFGYISGGSGDELTLRENIAGFDDFNLPTALNSLASVRAAAGS